MQMLSGRVNSMRSCDHNQCLSLARGPCYNTATRPGFAKKDGWHADRQNCRRAHAGRIDINRHLETCQRAASAAESAANSCDVYCGNFSCDRRGDVPASGWINMAVIALLSVSHRVNNRDIHEMQQQLRADKAVGLLWKRSLQECGKTRQGIAQLIPVTVLVNTVSVVRKLALRCRKLHTNKGVFKLVLSANRRLISLKIF